MKFYILEEIPEHIGQVEETDNTNYDRWGPKGYTQIPLEGTIPPGIHLPLCFLADRSTQTDFLNVVAFGHKFLVVSSNTLHLTGNFDLDYHSVLDIEVVNKRQNAKYPYHCLHFPWFRNELYMDWEKTSFTVKEAFVSVGEIRFENYLEYRQWRSVNFKVGDKSSKSAFLKNLVLKTDVIKKDLFMVNDTSRIYIGSERLKAAFETHNISGVRFVEHSSIRGISIIQ